MDEGDILQNWSRWPQYIKLEVVTQSHKVLHNMCNKIIAASDFHQVNGGNMRRLLLFWNELWDFEIK